MQINPTDERYEQSLANWFHELSGHDKRDTRGLLLGISVVLGLIASRTETVTTSPLDARIDELVGRRRR